MYYRYLVLMCVLAAGAMAAEPASIAEGVEQLGARDFEDREAASHYLWLQGLRARDALVKAAESDDPEVQVRARDILGKIDAGVLPDTPPEVAEMLGEWNKRSRGDRMRIMNELLKRDEPVPTTIIALLENETDAIVVRKAWEDSEVIPHLVDVYLANKLSGSDMERLLRTRYGVDDDQFPDYVAWVLLTDRLEAAIAFAREAYGDGTGEGAATKRAHLARLLWAAEKREEALALIDAGGPSALRDRMYFEDRQYGKVADSYAAKGALGEMDLDDLTRYLTLARLAGRDAVADQIAEQLVARAAAGNRETQATVAASLVANQRLDQAQALLATLPNADLELMLMLSTRGEGGSLALIQAVADDPDREFEAIADTTADEIRRRLGDVKATDAYINSLMAKGNSARGDLLSALVEANRYDEAYALGLAMITDDATAALDVTWRFHTHGQLLWYYVQVKHPDDTAVDRFHIWQPLVEGLTDDTIDGYLLELATNIEAVPPDNRSSVRNAVTDTLYNRGYVDEAYATIKPAFANQNVGTQLFAAAVCMKLERWEEAAGYYAAVESSDLGNLRIQQTTAIMYATALERLGKQKDAAAKRRRADLTTLANTRLRHDAVVQLERQDAYEESMRQIDITRRLLGGAVVEDSVLGMSYRFTALTENPALVATPDRQADDLEHSLAADEETGELTSMVQIARQVAILRMRAAIAAERFDDAIAHYRVADAYSPTDSDVTIELVNGLRDGGREADAAAVLDAHADFWLAKLELFPRDATAHNNLAWACARTHRRLDEALAHATKAVELEPRSAAFLDTLGEVYFQRGDREKAVATQKRAALYTNDISFMRGRIKSFAEDPLPGK